MKILDLVLKGKWYDLSEPIYRDEEWRAVNGYEGLYQVSNYGRVKRLISKFCPTERVIKPYISSTGYWNIVLSKNGKGKTHKLHRIVALAFIPNPLNKKEVGHKDESRLNPMASNLEWVSTKENCNMPLHRKRITESLLGRKDNEVTKKRKRESQLGEKSHLYGRSGSLSLKAKAVMQFTKGGIFIREYGSIADAYRDLGIAPTHISSCYGGKRKSAGGFVWRYAV